MRTQKASWKLSQSYMMDLFAELVDESRQSVDCFGLFYPCSRDFCRRSWPIPLDIKLPVALDVPLFCGNWLFVSSMEQIPDWSLHELKRIYRQNKPCKIPWHLDQAGVRKTACDDCIKFRRALLGLEPETETCHVAKKIKLQ